MATLVPKFNLATSYPEIVFIADQSGSMQGSKNNALVSALTIFIKSLPLGVCFNICAFGSSYKTLWPKSQAYNEANMKAAIEFVGTFNATYGGTEILHPVEAAFENMLGDMPLEVMLLTDGEIWGEQTLFDYINTQVLKKGTNARVFTLGIGSDVSHTLVEGVARAGNGFAQFVTQDEETDQKVVRMLKGALYPHLTDRAMEVRYANDRKDSELAKDDGFELVENVDYCLNIKESHEAQSAASGPDNKKQTAVKKIMSFFDASADPDKPIRPVDTDRYAHLPSFDTPKILQAPSEVPSLFPFNRTTTYLVLGPDAPQERVSSITLRANSPQGPLELTIEANDSEVIGTTVHQLAARKAIQELEEGRGWLQSAKTTTGSLIRDVHESRFDEIVEREAVRLGESFQVAGKWTSFVAVQPDGSSNIENQPAQPLHAAAPAIRRQLASRSAAMLPSPTAAQQAPQSSMAACYAPGGFGSASDTFSRKKKKVSAPAAAAASPAAGLQQLQQQQQAPTTRMRPIAPAESSESDDDMGYALFDSDDPPKATPSASPLHSLISLQTFVGAWDWNRDFFAVLMQGKKPEFAAAFGSEQFMATALAVAYMETKLINSKDVWEMVVSKAKTWMGTQVHPEAVDDLIEKAKGLL
jgi:hypothetical protein